MGVAGGYSLVWSKGLMSDEQPDVGRYWVLGMDEAVFSSLLCKPGRHPSAVSFSGLSGGGSICRTP